MNQTSALVTRRMHQQLLMPGNPRPLLAIFARLQLFGIAAIYFFLPAVTDGPSLVFGVLPVDGRSPSIGLSMMLAFGGLLGFIVGTGAIFVSYIRNGSFPGVRGLYRWATEFK